MRLFLFSIFVVSAIADPTFFTKALDDTLSSNGTDPVDQIRDLICPINGQSPCDGALRCAEILVESEGCKTDCLIPTIVSSSFHAGIPPIGKLGSELAHFLEFFVVLRNKFYNLIHESDNSLISEMLYFFWNNLPAIAEKAILENSFDAVKLDVSAEELLECSNINRSAVLSCYAKIHTRLLFDQIVTKMLEDAPAFEELAQILYNGNLAEVKNLPIVIKSLQEGINQNRNINHRLQESFQQIKNLRKQRRIPDCHLKRYIRQIYLLLNINDNRYVDTQSRIDRLQCQKEETIVTTKEEAEECIFTHGLLINNGSLTVEEKLAEIQASKWSNNDTVHYAAFTYIIYNKDVYEEYHTSDEILNYQIEYKNALWEELKRSCKENFILENGTEQGLSVYRESDFLDFNWTYPLRKIHEVEQMVKDRIFLDSEEGRHVRNVLEIARGSGSATEKMNKIRVEVIYYAPLIYHQVFFIRRLVWANVYKDTIKAQFGEETALGFLKEIELIFAGIYRRETLLFFNDRFNNVDSFVKHLHERNELLEVLLPCLEKNLEKLGITRDILEKLKNTVTGFDVQQLHTMLAAFETINLTCENTQSTGIPVQSTTTDYTTTEGTSPTYYRTEGTSPTYYTTERTYPTYYRTEGTSPTYYTTERTSPTYSKTEGTYPTYYRAEGTSPTYYTSEGTSPTFYTTTERSTTVEQPEPFETSSPFPRSSSSFPSSSSPFPRSSPSFPSSSSPFPRSSPSFPSSSSTFEPTFYTTTEKSTSSAQCTCSNKISIIAEIDFCQLKPKFSGVLEVESGRKRRSTNNIENAATALAQEIFGLEGNDGKTTDEDNSLAV